MENLARCNPHLGPVPLAWKLEKEENIRLNATTIWRILKRRKVRYGTNYSRYKEDSKLYSYDEPGAELQFDTSFPFGRKREVVSFDAIDDCSRFVLADLYETNTIKNAVDFIHRLVSVFPGRIKAIRTDNQFDTKEFRECLTSYGITHIVNPPYTPEHNGKIERFHKTMKREFYWRCIRPTDDLEYIRYQLKLWLYHYNYERPHSGLKMNGRTPAQKLASSYLEAHYNLIPVIRQDDFHLRQEDFLLVT